MGRRGGASGNWRTVPPWKSSARLGAALMLAFVLSALPRVQVGWRRIFRILAAIALLPVAIAEPVIAQTALPIPPGSQIIIGPVVRGRAFPFAQRGTSVPQITNGLEANVYLDGLVTPSTLSFVNSVSSPAVVVLTTTTTQFVRFYNPTDPIAPSNQSGSFIAGSNVVRGLTAAQVRDVLALPNTPTMQTLVQVPAGTCLLIGTAGPILNSTQPPLGVWGRGGVTQVFVIGQQQNGAGCSSAAQFPLFIPLSSFINGQPIGAGAFIYGPRAGTGGNIGAVAGALDHGPFPELFTPMDGLYNSLDVLNIGNAGPLRAALVQLTGEVHASAQTVMLGDSLFLRSAILGRVRQATVADGLGPMASLGASGPGFAQAIGTDAPPGDPPGSALAFAGASKPALVAPSTVLPPQTMFWAQGIGAWGKHDGRGDVAAAKRDLAGVFVGLDRRVDLNWLAGMAAGYTNSFVRITDRANSANINTGHFAAYTGGSLGAWNLRGAASASFHALDTTRDVNYPGYSDSLSARYHATTAQVFGEVGYGLSFGQVAAEPFAGLAYVHLSTGGFAENGGGAALTGSGGDIDLGYSTLGARAAANYALPNGFVLTPHASLAWQHVFGRDTPTASLAFAGGGAPFTTSGVPLARDAALVEAGFDLALSSRLRFQLVYVGEFADRAQDNSVSGNLVWRF